MNVDVLKKMLTSMTIEKQNCEAYNKILKDENEKLREKIHKLKNERGAGRKNKFNEHDVENIKMYRLQGRTIKEIAEIYSCSVGLIHKLINEK